LAPGERVTQNRLAEAFGLSRPAARLALNRLCQDGLAQVVPRQGYLIAPITLQDARDLFGLRLILEPAAARLAAGRLDAAQLRTLEQLCGVRFRRFDRQNIEAFRRNNTALHLAVARASGNQRLVAMIADVLYKMERVLNVPHLARVYNRYEQSYRGHRRLLAVLRAGDAQRAEQVMVDQIAAAEKVAIEVLMQSPSLQSVNLVSA
jgi:DNA-binding GntR family transcriptional regulator